MGCQAPVTLDFKFSVEEMHARLDEVMSRFARKGEFRVITFLEDPPVLIEVTRAHYNDLCRAVTGNCVLTGKEYTHGLYTEEQQKRLGPALKPMEVIAWVSQR